MVRYLLVVFVLIFFFLRCKPNLSDKTLTKKSIISKKEIVKQIEFTNLDSALMYKGDVRVLNLSDKGLHSFPEEVFEFRNLEKLYLGFNRIEVIPTRIKELKKLKILNFGYDYIKIIPDEISELSNLEELNLLENEVTTIPESLCKLPRLKKLNLIMNQISDVPDCLFEAPAIEFIGLAVARKSEEISESRKKELFEKAKKNKIRLDF